VALRGGELHTSSSYSRRWRSGRPAPGAGHTAFRLQHD